jgi:hypothetical protein
MFTKLKLRAFVETIGLLIGAVFLVEVFQYLVEVVGSDTMYEYFKMGMLGLLIYFLYRFRVFSLEYNESIDKIKNSK